MQIPIKIFGRIGLVLLVLMISCQTQPINNSSENSISNTVILQPKSKKREFTRNLIIYYQPDLGKAPLMQAVEDFGAELIYEYKALRGIAIRIPEEKSMEQALLYFKKVKGVLSVHRDEIKRLDPPVKN
ncbi:MAG: hypothetical protein Q4G27_09330 [Flavobacteriaceae bacterium]|nr:hypothetical protein [Flavobacteriaceae bacterium]